jgi:hypothetical protein
VSAFCPSSAGVNAGGTPECLSARGLRQSARGLGHRTDHRGYVVVVRLIAVDAAALTYANVSCSGCRGAIRATRPLHPYGAAVHLAVWPAYRWAPDSGRGWPCWCQGPVSTPTHRENEQAPFTYVFADEAQDLGVSQLRRLASGLPRPLPSCGEVDQMSVSRARA